MDAPELSATTQTSDSARFDGIDIDILADGTVRLHTACKPGQDPAECAEQVQFLVEALGLPLEAVVTEVTPAAPVRRRPDL